MTVVAARQVAKTIRGSTVLDDVSLELASGRVYGFRGANGSGKTMLMRALCGLIRPTKGEVAIDGQVLGRDLTFPPSAGVLIENPAFLKKHTAFANLRLLAMIRGVVDADGIRQTLRAVGLNPADRRPYRKFSLGMKQRLGIAAALMERPRLIILDEPTNGLDADGVRLLRELLAEHRRDGALVVLSSHDQAELEFLADEIFEFADGRVTRRYGSPAVGEAEWQSLPAAAPDVEPEREKGPGRAKRQPGRLSGAAPRRSAGRARRGQP
jgi:ABC-2 type transport system ATP-binding protein